MKIRYRILIINFAIVVLIIGSSAVAFYSIMYNALTSQRSQYLVRSANDFIYAYRELVQDTDDDFLYAIKNSTNLSVSLNEKNIDFIFEASKSGNLIKQYSKDFVYIPQKSFSVEEFISNNPSAIVKKYVDENGKTYFYGRVLSNEILNQVSQKINAEIAVVVNNTPLEISNQDNNQNFVYTLSEAYKDLKNKNNFELYTKSTDQADIVATIYRNPNSSELTDGAEFLIFNTVSEAVDLRSNLKSMLIILGIAGVVLSLILTFLFTDRIRKQLTQLSEATGITKGGNFKARITIKSKDEIGELARAFNDMLDDLEKNQNAKQEYSEFITLINQNPTLKEISEVALRKIIKTCKLSIGALYLVEKEGISLLSSYGLSGEHKINNKSELFEPVIRDKETVEIDAAGNLPVINTGSLSLAIRSLLVVPIVYNNKVIAVIELGGFDKPSPEAREYLSSIQEQLAIGLTNATALVQLENLVSELKKLNDDYLKQNEQITKQNEKLIELHKELKDKADELARQKEKAEESTKMKSQFLANMSHELRTPMNSILGLTELILESSTVKGKNKERLEVVLKSGKRLMNLINDILDLSKIEAGRMDIREDQIVLDELIEDVDNAIMPLALNKNIEFRVKRDINTHIHINTDKGKVTQVLINLLGNAVKFTDKGHVELGVSAPDQNTLKFDVVDSGIGMSQDSLQIIFEEFRQVDGTTTRKYGGTGLGLTICKKIADLLGGNITVKSEVGKGSVFTFTIPLKVVEIRAEKTEEPKVNIDTLIKNRQHPILIIDDDPEIRYTIGQYLISRGYEVVYAEDGEQGMEKAIKIQPFAITLDVMLPKKDGWNILKDFKEHPATRDIPVILISVMGDKNLGYGLGAFEYFVKPISSDKLLTAFAKLENLAKKNIEKIVIVDDDEMEFEKFRREFKNDKIRIEYIKDSSLAYSKILEIQPDLIILDLLMPNIDGLSLSHKLKSNKETRHIPIIISTAKDLTDEEKTSLNNTVEDITVKSKGHPLDVLKIVRDRIKMHEDYSTASDRVTEYKNAEEVDEISEEEIPETEEINDETEYKGKVLLVDDDPDTLFTVNEIVQSCQCKTILANSGEECIEALKNEIPDLILLDIMMPGMDGFQTLNKIKENQEWANIPVFAVTAKAMVGDREIIIKHGFDDYIPKPVNAVIMAFKIEKLFTKIGSGQ
jgi:signal transduction histidine kinase/CheY-like chemotaxis protein/HAMP domain-containing protein